MTRLSKDSIEILNRILGFGNSEIVRYLIQMKKLIPIVMALTLYSCTSAPVATKAPEASTPKPSVAPQVSSEPEVENIDYDALQGFLKLKRGYNRLGYAEKAFNTCEVGYGYSSTHNCRKLNFVVIHFQLMCRDSEGTVTEAVTAANIQPISRQPVKWTLKNAVGRTQTDSEGYGQIAIVSKISQRYERLKLTVGDDFLFMKAGEITQMITPKSWCE